ncbi:amidohydrolase family protein [Spirillospora sp. NPDC048819]|uniref:amidohydrolase family protein n=1 Tax=Spirillospora sp. NPDC048819 TaxID=3155268 RepID=UPI0033C4832B
MALSLNTKLISVDDHLIEHPTLWLDRLPSRWHESAPHIVEVENGEQWCFEGVVNGPTGLSAVVGTELRERALDPPRFADMRRACWDPAARIADMDTDGVQMQLCFPNYSGFAGGRFYRAKDKELALLCVQAYNDFVIDEWCAAAPGRYIPMMILPLWNVELSAREIERCVARGFRAIAFPDNPAILGEASFQSGEWDPVFARAAEAELPLCMHFGGSGLVPPISADAPLAVQTTVMGATLFASMAELLLSPVFHNHPNLKVAYSEGQIGWMPYALQRIDQVWNDYRHFPITPTINSDVRPSDLFREHVYGCFIDDQVGVDQRHLIGVDNILWESDYPHADSLWPRSRTVLEKLLSDVPEDEAHKIAEGNARRLFRV